jgi:hypothetical protein
MEPARKGVEMTLSAIGGRELSWVYPDDPSHPFVLRANGEEIGRLEVARGTETTSTGELDGRKWTLETSGAFHPHITVRVEDSPDAVAVFTASRAGGGSVAFTSGSTYAWTRTSIWGEKWCFRCAGGKSGVCVSLETGPLKNGGKAMICRGAAYLPEAPVLLLLAWFLRILAFERLEEAPLEVL